MRRIVSAISTVALAFSLVASATPANAAVAGYDSAYAGESAFLTLAQGASGTFTVFFANTGSTSWTRGSSTQVDLAACLEDKVTCNAQDASEAPFNSGWLSTTRYATHTQTTVAPGQIGTFTYNVAVPATQAAGTYRFNGALVLASTGADIRNEGYYQDVTVTAPTAVVPAGIAVTPSAQDLNRFSSSTTDNTGVHTYTATVGALSGTVQCVDIMLINGSNANTSDGTFADADGTNSAGNDQADIGTIGTAVIETINGLTVGATSYANCITVPSNGTITFVVDATGNARIRPVVFQDANSDNALNLDAANKATESAGVGGEKLWVWAEASFGTHTSLDVTFVRTAYDIFCGGTDTQGHSTECFEYDANDTFQFGGVGITMSEFEAQISSSPSDELNIAYATDPSGVSTFNIVAQGAPPAPTSVSTTVSDYDADAAQDDTRTTVTWASTVGTGSVKRVSTADGGTCATAGVTVASGLTTDSATPSVVTDLNVPTGTYFYCARTTSGSGDFASNSAWVQGNTVTVPGTGDTIRPKSLDVRQTTSAGLAGQLDAGDVFKIAFDETMNPDSTGDQIRVQDADGTTLTIFCRADPGADPAGSGSASCQFNTVATETLGGVTYAINRVLTVTIVDTTASTLSTEVGTVAGLQIPTTIIDAGGITDTAGNAWDVAGSPDRVIDVEP